MEKNRGLQLFIGLIILVVIAAIVAGFFFIGSPANRRLIKMDQQRINDLSTIRGNVVNFWEVKERLPQDYGQLEGELLGWTVPVDPETEETYVYEITGELSFRICADFARATENEEYAREYYYDHYLLKGDSFAHEAGEQCFEWTIDKEAHEKSKDGISPRPVY